MTGSYEILTHVPYIALILCYALGSAIYIGLAEWSRSIAHGHYNHKTPFQTISPWFKAAFVTVVLASLMRQLIFISESEASYIVELSLLAVIMSVFLVKHKLVQKESWQKTMHNALLFMKKTGLYCLFVSLFWAILMGFFLLSLLAIQNLKGLLPLDISAFQLSVMATGLIALAPFHIWYNKAKKGKGQGHLDAPEHYRFHHILWPFIVGLLLFILPLFIENLASSEEYQDLINAKPALELI